MHDQGIIRALCILMNKHTGALVAQNDIFILIRDRQFGLDAGQCPRILLGRIEKLIADKELNGITLFEHIVLLCAGSIDLDLLGADVFIHQRHGQAANGLGQKFIQSLSCIIFLNGQNLHVNSFRQHRDGEQVSFFSAPRTVSIYLVPKIRSPASPRPGTI